MKAGAWIAIVCSFAAAPAFAQPCTAPPLPVVPQYATTADAVQVQLQNVSNYFYAGNVAVNGSDILIDVDIPGIPPPPGFPLGCATLTTNLGLLPAGTYTIRWREIPLPAAALVAGARPVSPQQFGSIIATATLPVTVAVPLMNVAGLLLLACLLATAGVFVLRR